MEITTQQEGTGMQVTLVGSVDETGAEQMKAAFASLPLGGVETVVVHCEQMSYIGSSGIGKLLLFYKNLGVQGIQLRVVGVSAAIYELFVELKLGTIFHVEKR